MTCVRLHNLYHYFVFTPVDRLADLKLACSQFQIIHKENVYFYASLYIQHINISGVYLQRKKSLTSHQQLGLVTLRFTATSAHAVCIP